MESLPYFFDLLKNDRIIQEVVTKRALSANDLDGIKYVQKSGNMIKLTNFLLSDRERFRSASILISKFGIMVEFISKDLKYFDKADVFFNSTTIARKHPSYYKKGQEFKAKSKRLEVVELFDKTVHGTVLRSDLYGCKIMISFF